MSKLHRVGAIIKNKENIVLIHRVKNGEEYYAIPGGAIDQGETPIAAIKREINEELGLKLTSCKIILDSDSHDRRDYYFSATTADTKIIVTGEMEVKHLYNPVDLFEPLWVNKNTINKLLVIYPESGRQLVLNLLQ